MGKTTIIFRYILLPLLIISYMESYSQDSFTEELVWTNQDSIETVAFNDTNQITEWGKYRLIFSTVYSKHVVINNTEVFVLIILGCSGMPCWEINVFRKEGRDWHLLAKTDSRSLEKININVDFGQKKILFTTKSGQIGELPFDVLD